MSKPQDIATDFLQLVIAGQIDEAYDRYVDLSGKHHNLYTEAGFAALREGMKEAEQRSPNKRFSIKQVVGDGELVVTYSNLVTQKGSGMAVMHMFRIVNGKITELWDCGQAIPADSPNSDGAF